MLRAAWIGVMAVCVMCRAQPPSILQQGVRNAASRVPPALATGWLAPDSRIEIEGVRLEGATVRMGGQTAVVEESSARRLIAIVPANLKPGAVDVVVESANGTSRPQRARIAPAAPGLFSRNGLGWGPADDRLYRPGQRVTLRATGLRHARQFAVFTGNALVSGARVRVRAGGVDEVEFALPAAAPVGCFVPVQVVLPDGRASNTVTLRISPGAACATPAFWPEGPHEAEGSLGLLALVRWKMQLATAGAAAEFIDDSASARFTRTGRRELSGFAALPPPGTCVTYAGLLTGGARHNLLEAWHDFLPGEALDAGRLTIEHQGQVTDLPADRHGLGGYFRRLGGDRPDSAASLPLFLRPGEYRVSGAGGPGIGAFEAKVDMPALPEWEAPRVIQLGRDLRIASTARPRSGTAQIFAAMNLDAASTAFGACICVADPRAAGMLIPARALAGVPPGMAARHSPLNLVLAATLVDRRLPRLRATGLAFGFAFGIAVDARNVVFRR